MQVVINSRLPCRCLRQLPIRPFAIEPGLIADTESGRVYTDASGMTLYTDFGKDKPGQSSCYDKCAVNWPPFIAEDGASRRRLDAGRSQGWQSDVGL